MMYYVYDKYGYYIGESQYPVNNATLDPIIEIPSECKARYIGDEWVIVNRQEWELDIEVPNSITPRQARLALLQATLLDEVELMLASDKAMQIWWEYSLEILRDHPHIIAMGTALGLTEAQLDELFILGATL